METRSKAETLVGPDLYWLAGWLEGEGCFTASYRQGHGLIIKIQASSVDRDTIEHAAEIAGGRVNGPYVNSSRPGCQPFYNWTLGKRAEVVPLLRSLCPLMGRRRKAKIEEALQLAEQHPAGRNPYGNRPRAAHGTRSRYNAYGCRCEPCRAASSEYQRQRRADRQFNAETRRYEAVAA